MSQVPNNQCTLSLNIQENSSYLQAQFLTNRRGNKPCEKQPKCPFAGSWRKDTKSAGGEKYWCVQCLKNEQEENKKF